VVDGLVMAALRVRPLALLKMVREHRKLFWQRAQPVVRWAAILLWAVLTLEWASVRDIVAGWLDKAWAFGVSAGTFSLTVGQLVTFGLTVWAAVMISRFVRFILEEDVYPRFQLARGLPYAISTVLHYAILVVGFVAAVGALGYDLTKFTILAGAFGVGLGFGLQNIFNNFVSGLILLFERPIKVGDVVQVGDATGVVRRIGIRASVIRTTAGAEVIVPNGKLIADPVTNWTLSSRGRWIELALGTPAAADPRVVMSTWAKVALRHPKVADDPPPKATLAGFGGDALKFELRAWTTEFESWADTRSDLAVAVNAALAEAGIGIK
jgi:small-conductance mechanosensitive channel